MFVSFPCILSLALTRGHWLGQLVGPTTCTGTQRVFTKGPFFLILQCYWAETFVCLSKKRPGKTKIQQWYSTDFLSRRVHNIDHSFDRKSIRSIIAVYSPTCPRDSLMQPFCFLCVVNRQKNPSKTDVAPCCGRMEWTVSFIFDISLNSLLFENIACDGSF